MTVPGTPALSELTGAERDWIAHQLDAATTIAHHYASESQSPPDPAQLDATLESWFGDDLATRIDANDLINAIGIAFGHHLSKRAGLDWVIATDEFGQDLALSGQPGDILVYPANAIAKRVARGEFGFISSLVESMVTDIEAIKRTA